MTDYHVLTSAQLDAIASGDPDALTIETLLSGQYSKRIVMISAILAAAADRCPGECARLEAAWDLLAAAQQADPSAARALLTHPSLGRWAADCLRRVQSPADPLALATELGQLAAFAAAAAIRAGHVFVIEVPARDGAVFLPTLGLATFDQEISGTLCSPAFATVTHDGQRVTIAVGRSVITVPVDPSHDGSGWRGLRYLRACHGGTSITVGLDDLDPGWGAGGEPLPVRLSDGAVAAWQSLLTGAWETLTRHHPRRASALASGVRCIVPLEPVGKAGRSSTSPDGFGGHMLTPPREALSFADTLVHEFSHSVLSAVADTAPLHTAGPGAVYYSPWRNDPRPIEGLLQGAYAYLGVTSFWEIQRNALTGRHQALADFQFARWRHQIRTVARELRESGTLTHAGMVIVQEMTTAAERWHDLPVAEESRQLATRAAADHRIRWRLRNHRPAQSAVDAFARAWQDGELRSGRPDEVPITVVSGQGLLGHGDRSRLFRLRLNDPDRFRELYAAQRSLMSQTPRTTSSERLTVIAWPSSTSRTISKPGRA